MSKPLGFTLTDDELSALIEACNVANSPGSKPRPPWSWAGRSAWDKLIREEMRRGKNKVRTP